MHGWWMEMKTGWMEREWKEADRGRRAVHGWWMEMRTGWMEGEWKV